MVLVSILILVFFFVMWRCLTCDDGDGDFGNFHVVELGAEGLVCCGCAISVNEHGWELIVVFHVVDLLDVVLVRKA